MCGGGTPTAEPDEARCRRTSNAKHGQVRCAGSLACSHSQRYTLQLDNAWLRLSIPASVVRVKKCLIPL